MSWRGTSPSSSAGYASWSRSAPAPCKSRAIPRRTPTTPTDQMICLSFDIEERFHSHLTDGTARREWKAGDRIAQIIDLLLEHERPATFFIVGELAEHYPALIRRAADSGLEIGSHTHTHIRLDTGDRVACTEDI